MMLPGASLDSRSRWLCGFCVAWSKSHRSHRKVLVWFDPDIVVIVAVLLSFRRRPALTVNCRRNYNTTCSPRMNFGHLEARVICQRGDGSMSDKRSLVINVARNVGNVRSMQTSWMSRRGTSANVAAIRNSSRSWLTGRTSTIARSDPLNDNGRKEDLIWSVIFQTSCLRYIPSLLQHIKHTQPGSPLRTINTVKFLANVRDIQNARHQWTYTMLLVKVQQAPTKVRKATLRRREFAWLFGRFLNE